MNYTKIKNFFKNDFNVLLFFSLLAIFPLVIVYVLQYFFGVEPCKLCIYQRFPLFVIALLPSMFIGFKNHSFKGFFIVMFAVLCNVALSFYHLGIENKWFINTSCKGFNGAPTAMEKFFLSTSTLFQQCDVVKFRFLGISLSGWNFIYCLLFFILINFFVIRRFLNRNL